MTLFCSGFVFGFVAACAKAEVHPPAADVIETGPHPGEQGRVPVSDRGNHRPQPDSGRHRREGRENRPGVEKRFALRAMYGELVEVIHHPKGNKSVPLGALDVGFGIFPNIAGAVGVEEGGITESEFHFIVCWQYVARISVYEIIPSCALTSSGKQITDSSEEVVVILIC